MKSALKRFLPLILFSAMSAAAFAETVTMKIVFENPSELDDKTDRMKAYLPPEIRKEQILDTGGLGLDYDASSSIFYVYKDLTLKPKEKANFQIVIEDVWRIPQQELDFIMSQADDRLAQLEGSEDYDDAQVLRDKIVNLVNEIKTTQDSQLGDVKKRIDSYRINKERLRAVRYHVILLKDFKQESEIESDIVKYPKEIRFVINVKNPSDVNPKKEEVLRYLPEGITPDNIISLQGFDIKYDVTKKAYYVVKEISLEPSESKQFVITINDRWSVAQPKLDGYRQQAKDINDFLANTEFKPTAEYLYNEIVRYADDILNSQTKAVTIKDRIAVYYENVKKVEAIKQNLLEMERLQQIIKERERQNRLEEFIKKLAPNEKTIWKIIYGTIIFLAIIGLATYILWWGQTRQRQVRKYDDISPDKK